MSMFRSIWMVVFLISTYSFAVDVVADPIDRNTDPRQQVGLECHEFILNRPVYLFKDLNIIGSNLRQSYLNGGRVELSEEGAVITELKGTVYLWRKKETELKDFGLISILEREVKGDILKRDPRGKLLRDSAGKLLPVKMTEVKVCGGAYHDTLGFVLSEDLKMSQTARMDGSRTPPSTPGNPIPTPVINN